MNPLPFILFAAALALCIRDAVRHRDTLVAFIASVLTANALFLHAAIHRDAIAAALGVILILVYTITRFTHREAYRARYRV